MGRILKTFSRILFLFLAVCLIQTPVHGEEATVKSIHWVEAEGIIDPVMAEYLVESISKAEESKAEVVVI